MRSYFQSYCQSVEGTGQKEFFSENVLRYDEWYEKHSREYRDQIEFIRPLIPHGKGIEIGVGTGRFAAALKIEYGVDYVKEMVEESRKRGINAIHADAAKLPFPDGFFDFSFSIVTMCFLDDPMAVLRESKRIARLVINVILDRDCEYIRNIIRNPRGFYKYATFYTEGDLVDMYRKSEFVDISVERKDLQTSDGETYRLIAVSGRSGN